MATHRLWTRFCAGWMRVRQCCQLLTFRQNMQNGLVGAPRESVGLSAGPRATGHIRGMTTAPAECGLCLENTACLCRTMPQVARSLLAPTFCPGLSMYCNLQRVVWIAPPSAMRAAALAAWLSPWHCGYVWHSGNWRTGREGQAGAHECLGRLFHCSAKYGQVVSLLCKIWCGLGACPPGPLVMTVACRNDRQQ